MRRGGDALISVGVLALVLMTLAAMDVRVRERLGALLRGPSGSDVDSLGDQLRTVGGTMVVALWDQSVANAPLTIFVAVAVVLTVFMVRS